MYGGSEVQTTGNIIPNYYLLYGHVEHLLGILLLLQINLLIRKKKMVIIFRVRKTEFKELDFGNYCFQFLEPKCSSTAVSSRIFLNTRTK